MVCMVVLFLSYDDLTISRITPKLLTFFWCTSFALYCSYLSTVLVVLIGTFLLLGIPPLIVEQLSIHAFTLRMLLINSRNYLSIMCILIKDPTQILITSDLLLMLMFSQYSLLIRTPLPQKSSLIAILFFFHPLQTSNSSISPSYRVISNLMEQLSLLDVSFIIVSYLMWFWQHLTHILMLSLSRTVLLHPIQLLLLHYTLMHHYRE